MYRTEQTTKPKDDKKAQEIYQNMRQEVKTLSDAFKKHYGEDYNDKQEREMREENK